MPLLSRSGFVGLSLSLLLGSGCFEDPPQGSSGGTDASDGGETGAADETSATQGPTGDPSGNPTGGGCVGCLDAAGGCLAGDLDQACGVLAETCVACDDASFCNEGTCERLPACNENNCDGCCDGDECLLGTDTSACGDAGEHCAVCTSDSTCNEGSCELPCSTTCDGCCDASGDCIPLDTTAEAACGAQGEACTQCMEDFTCSKGICISTACQSTCGGCCVGDDCMPGDAISACGGSGAACLACPSGTVCGGTCIADESTLWRVVIDSATTAATAQDGSNWDPGGGLPDPYVRITLAGETQSTGFEDNTVTPVWEHVLFEGISTADLLAAPGVYELLDDDVGLNDSMGQCTFLLGEDQFGVPLVADCTDDSDEPLWSLQFSIVAAD